MNAIIACLVLGLFSVSQAASADLPRVDLAEADRVMREGQAGAIFRECRECPEMVIVPAGEFLIGSPDDEVGRGADEAPRRRVRIDRRLAVSRREVTRDEYAAFLRATAHAVKGGCITDRIEKGSWVTDAHTTVWDPGFKQKGNEPVACVSWHDARAYITWINEKSAGGYRLPAEAEWEFVARAGSVSAYPWGEAAEEGCEDGNLGDLSAAEKYPGLPWAQCSDGFLNTAPAGSYRPNRFGVYDMIGNVGEWTEDCASNSYEALSDEGKPNVGELCDKRIVRGGSWGTMIKDFRVANRMRYSADTLDDSIGIRMVKDLPLWHARQE